MENYQITPKTFVIMSAQPTKRKRTVNIYMSDFKHFLENDEEIFDDTGKDFNINFIFKSGKKQKTNHIPRDEEVQPINETIEISDTEEEEEPDYPSDNDFIVSDDEEEETDYEEEEPNYSSDSEFIVSDSEELEEEIDDEEEEELSEDDEEELSEDDEEELSDDDEEEELSEDDEEEELSENDEEEELSENYEEEELSEDDEDSEYKNEEDEETDDEESELYSEKLELANKLNKYVNSKIKNVKLQDKMLECIDSIHDIDNTKRKLKRKMTVSYLDRKKRMKCDFCNRTRNVDTQLVFCRKPFYIGTQCSERIRFIKSNIDVLNSGNICKIIKKSQEFYTKKSSIEKKIENFYK